MWHASVWHLPASGPLLYATGKPPLRFLNTFMPVSWRSRPEPAGASMPHTFMQFKSANVSIKRSTVDFCGRRRDEKEKRR